MDKPNCFGFASTYGWSVICGKCPFNQECSVQAKLMTKALNEEAQKKMEQHIEDSSNRYEKG